MPWKKVVFTDEKKFSLDGPDGYKYYFHDLRKEERFLSRRQCGGWSIMLWGSISYNGALTRNVLQLSALDLKKIRLI